MEKNLQRYLDLDKQIRRIEQELNGTEERKRTRQLNQALHDAEASLNKMEKRSREIETTIQQTQASLNEKMPWITEYAKNLEDTKDETELDYLQRKFNELKKSINDFERLLSSLQRELNDLAAAYRDYSRKVPQWQREYREWRDKFKQLQNTRMPEVQQIQSEMRELEKQIDPKLIEKYKEMKKQKIVAPFVNYSPEEGLCGGCRMAIPEGQRSKLKAQGYVECENCHRIVFLP